MKKGKVIALSGLDGSGKSTQIRLLIRDLEIHGIKARYTYNRWDHIMLRFLNKFWRIYIKRVSKINNETEYRYNKNKEKLRRSLFANPLFRYFWIAYFIFEYSIQLFIDIRIRKMMGDIIISDRITYDSIIDLAVDLGEHKDKFLNLFDSLVFRKIFPEPDIMIYIDCPEDVVIKRKDDILDMDYLKARKKIYQDFARKFAWFKVDGTMPVDDINKLIKDRVYEELGLSNV